MQERQPVRVVLVGSQRRLVHEPAHGEMRQQQAPELLAHQVRGLAAQYDLRPAQLRLQLGSIRELPKGNDGMIEECDPRHTTKYRKRRKNGKFNGQEGYAMFQSSVDLCLAADGISSTDYTADNVRLSAARRHFAATVYIDKLVHDEAIKMDNKEFRARAPELGIGTAPAAEHCHINRRRMAWHDAALRLAFIDNFRAQYMTITRRFAPNASVRNPKGSALKATGPSSVKFPKEVFESFMSRRTAFATGAILLFAFSFSTSALAQAPFSDEQKKAFADLFRMAEPRAAKVTTGEATLRERALILGAQDARVALPSTVPAYRAYLEQNPLMIALRKKQAPELGTLLLWNLMALDITAIDHTLLASPDANGHEQFGPHRTSRVLAIAHLAMFEAVNTIYDKYTSYKGIEDNILADLHAADATVSRSTLNPSKASVNTAIIAAAHDTLVALYPKKKDFLDLAEQKSLQNLGLGTDASQLAGKDKLGFALGQSAAKNVLSVRLGTHVQRPSLRVSSMTDAA